jgi:transposase
MVWGAIGPNGWRSTLVRCSNPVNRDSYIAMLTESGVIDEMNRNFGQGQFIFQHDNATLHKVARNHLLTMMNMLFWPAKSPDLSPIEQVWIYIKKRLKGRVYTSPIDLFDAISEEWTKVLQDVIKNLWDSFRARCEVCAKYHAECFN